MTELTDEDLTRVLPLLETSALADVLDGLGFPSQVMAPGPAPLTAPHRVAGRAACVGLGPKDAASGAPKQYFTAIDEVAAPGRVLVLQVKGEPRGAVMGGFMAQEFRRRGAQGVVTDGVIRDVPEIDAMGFPVFARRASPMNGAGTIQVETVGEPVTFPSETGAAVTVRQGDLVVADRDGVVVVPWGIARIVVDATLEFCEAERNIRQAIGRGVPRVQAMKDHDRFAHLPRFRAMLEGTARA